MLEHARSKCNEINWFRVNERKDLKDRKVFVYDKASLRFILLFFTRDGVTDLICFKKRSLTSTISSRSELGRGSVSLTSFWKEDVDSCNWYLSCKAWKDDYIQAKEAMDYVLKTFSFGLLSIHQSDLTRCCLTVLCFIAENKAKVGYLSLPHFEERIKLHSAQKVWAAFRICWKRRRFCRHGPQYCLVIRIPVEVSKRKNVVSMLISNIQ